MRRWGTAPGQWRRLHLYGLLRANRPHRPPVSGGHHEPLAIRPRRLFSLDNGATFEQPRTGETVPTNAIQSMQPVTASSDSLGSWGGFIQDSLRGVLGYSIARDAARNGVRSPSGQYYGQPEQQMQHVGQVKQWHRCSSETHCRAC